MSKIWSSTTLLILGVILPFLGMIPIARYDSAKSSGCEIEATIVEVVEDYDPDTYSDPYTYTVYVDYVYDGKEYTHVREGKYTIPKYVGDTVTIVVNPNNPGKPMWEGGVLWTAGTVLTVVMVIYKIVKRKKKEE